MVVQGRICSWHLGYKKGLRRALVFFGGGADVIVLPNWKLAGRVGPISKLSDVVSERVKFLNRRLSEVEDSVTGVEKLCSAKIVGGAGVRVRRGWAILRAMEARFPAGEIARTG